MCAKHVKMFNSMNTFIKNMFYTLNILKLHRLLFPDGRTAK